MKISEQHIILTLIYIIHRDKINFELMWYLRHLLKNIASLITGFN
jgi:hypothetical protein